VSFGRIRPLEERLAAYRAVTAADVQRVARTYLVDDQRSVLHVVAQADAPRPGAPPPMPSPSPGGPGIR
jgi:predicted Zn-dependent peptidase